ncbi:MAG: hypothetical protein GY694_13360 [Gammaproteobacteria bacterium]|nr:hypothetical protein [Gammaproteobacteria bacterium]
MITKILTKSIVSSFVSRIITATAHNAQVILEWMLNLDGTNYMELSEPKTFAGDFEWVFRLKPISTPTKMVIIGDLANESWVRLNADGTIYIKNPSNNETSPSLTGIFDGSVHTLVISRTGTALTYMLDNVVIGTDSGDSGTYTFNRLGVKELSTDSFQGIIHSVNLTDLDTPSNSISWNIDSGQPVYEVGSELVANGDFSNGDTDWSKGSGITIEDGSLIISNGSSSSHTTSINDTVVIGDTYVIEYEISSINNGHILVRAGWNDSGATNATTTGKHTDIVTSGGNKLIYITCATGTNATISNVSVKPYISTISDGTIYQDSEEYGTDSDIMRADDWGTPPAGVTVNGRTATFDGTQVDYATVKANLGEVYTGMCVVTFRVYGETQGLARVDVGNSPISPVVSAGVYTILQEAASDSIQVVCNNADFDGSVEIISVKPVSQGLIMQNVSTEDWAKQ